MSSPLDFGAIALVATLVAPMAARIGTADAIRVYDFSGGCGGSNEQVYEWQRVEGGFAIDGRYLPDAEVEALRAQILAAPKEAPDLLQQLGVTAEALRAHRTDIPRAAWPELLRPAEGALLELPQELEPRMTFEVLAPFVLSHLKGPSMSTMRYELRIEIPGDPPIAVESKSIAPWKLPWTIDSGTDVRTSSDTNLSLAIAQLLRAKSPNAAVIDGRVYWSDTFWRDELFWHSTFGEELDRHLIAKLSSALAGNSEAMQRFRIQESMSGCINGQNAALFFRMSSAEPSLVDDAWWWNPLKDGKPTATWTDFLRGYDTTRACVEQHAWLQEWKRSSPSNTLEAHVVGVVPFSATGVASFVQPAWKDAGLPSKPSVEIKLRRGGDWCGTVWLAPDVAEALITDAHSDRPSHGFDGLDLSFHPKAPTYGLVDNAGKATVRTIR